ncbi:hypothetical protein Rleg9DRAFT_7360 [Rhizobium leguminosarum bv. trifolii WSM597]|uniref:VWFA domain-containing protein n=1 Tax=Rhizobium leguminosarum bv. trifolii WSM597 TaxID=754764 RepID=I9N389_RHILT|nr:hypothetical protein [Rhizobium leguminosarum]EJB02324.1 hypothetical protein Rleg9DRAFT_1120 [Rhizobium leguminosarum bv. trifolii WSM597]EJB08313.1 hypothetical protein Rleg9DRAFT_7360 [Rhizobium leguminosarum bv. trifolii WSM597]
MARSNRRSRRRGGNSAALIIGAIALGILSLAIIGAFGWLKFRASATVAVDKASLCPVTGANSETAILLDVTDPISETTALDLKNQFESIVAGIPVGGAIDIYSLSEKEGELERTFHGCNPGSGELADEWTSNPRLIQDRWEKGFQKPLEDIAGKLASGRAGDASPIMAGIQRINLEAFSNLPVGTPKTLLIASDMIEHTPAFSNYRDGIDYSKFQKSKARDKFRTSLDGVSVKIFAFQRPNLKFTTQDLAEFWREWIAKNNGTFDGFVRLEGIR